MDKKSSKQLLQIVIESTHKMNIENSFLKTMQSGKLTIEQWKVYGVQRYLAALPFTTLLKAGISKARENGDERLRQALQLNLSDEDGVTSNGEISVENSHDQWRKNFYHALGISEGMLKKGTPFHGTSEYKKTIEKIATDGSMLEVAGALLILEATFPLEFKKIQIGRNMTFPEKFVDSPNDSAAIKQTKAKARKYIDDHILHDAQSHYPDIFSALSKYAKRKPISGNKERYRNGGIS